MHLALVRQVFTHIPTRSPWHCFAPTDWHQPPRARTGALAVRRDGVLVRAGARHRVRCGASVAGGRAHGSRGVKAPGCLGAGALAAVRLRGWGRGGGAGCSRCLWHRYVRAVWGRGCGPPARRRRWAVRAGVAQPRAVQAVRGAGCGGPGARAVPPPWGAVRGGGRRAGPWRQRPGRLRLRAALPEAAVPPLLRSLRAAAAPSARGSLAAQVRGALGRAAAPAWRGSTRSAPADRSRRGAGLWHPAAAPSLSFPRQLVGERPGGAGRGAEELAKSQRRRGAPSRRGAGAVRSGARGGGCRSRVWGGGAAQGGCLGALMCPAPFAGCSGTSERARDWAGSIPGISSQRPPAAPHRLKFRRFRSGEEDPHLP